LLVTPPPKKSIDYLVTRYYPHKKVSIAYDCPQENVMIDTLLATFPTDNVKINMLLVTGPPSEKKVITVVDFSLIGRAGDSS
jgi:hypothetical protein